MLKSKTDLIFVIIFFIVVASFLGMSIVNIIDKKLSNISINVPKIKLPKSEVTVNFEKNGNNFRVKCTKNIKKKKIINDNDSQDNDNDNENENDKDNEDNNDINFIDLESDVENENVELGEETEYEVEESKEDIKESMTGLTAEQFYNKHYINPYKPNYKNMNNNNSFKPYNINEYQ